jgi:hypothetical protein
MTHPTAPNPLMEFVLGLLAPFLMNGSITDPGLARAAAEQAIAACRTDGQQNLVSITQILGFALASLDNLRLSMPADVSLSMKLKLRGNANALHRSAQLATPDRQHREPAAMPAEPQPPRTEPDPRDTLVAIEDTRSLLQQAQTTQQPERRRLLSWASAMTDIAAEHAAALAQLPAAQRQDQLTRIRALIETARTLGTGNAPMKSQLLSGTSLRG